MDYHAYEGAGTVAEVRLSRFRGAGGVEELHLTVRALQRGHVETQLDQVLQTYRRVLDDLGLDLSTAVFRRFFCSDLPNQTAALQARALSRRHEPDNPCAVSWVGQAPLPPAKMALWAYHVSDPQQALCKEVRDATMILTRGHLQHRWTTGLISVEAESCYDQTRALFDGYQRRLDDAALSLSRHVLRTWLFVQNIDVNYAGMVAARLEVFREQGLTPETHFIASSGIDGVSTDLRAKVLMDAYAIGGVQPNQVEFLSALDHLSPTHIYGVTFERGTSVAYRDRKHVIISGTASIDAHGNILHAGDVSRQLDRTLENIEALLQGAGAALNDMGLFIVYVRDSGDADMVLRGMQDRVGNAPVTVHRAPVCRPGWLIEVEGLAVIPAHNPCGPLF